MGRVKGFTLVYDIGVRDHLRCIDRKHHTLIRKTIEKMLRHEPETEARNRKPLSRPSTLGTAWELRLGPNNRFRVFYRTKTESREVYILAVGEKDGSRLYIGGKEFRL